MGAVPDHVLSARHVRVKLPAKCLYPELQIYITLSFTVCVGSTGDMDELDTPLSSSHFIISKTFKQVLFFIFCSKV